MGAKVLTVSALQELDRGKVALAINDAIRACTLDVLDRPGLEKPRKVLIEIDFEPQTDPDSAALDVVKVGFSIKTRFPVRQSQQYPMLASREGTLGFQPLSPNDPRQGELYDTTRERVDPKTGEVTSVADDDEAGEDDE